ncbi:MAG: cyclic pyranopterin phosphate synthase [Pseudohongiellaceae bacterium]|jgi:cyclic pyranopterin phosphate synthase
MSRPLTHVSNDGRARMVDVGEKPLTRRRAVVSGRLVMAAETLTAALGAGGPKGPVIEVARLAGISGAKRTADLIPLCHSLPIDQVDISITADGDRALFIRAEVVTTWRTGVEMEAFSAVAVAGLTLIDMLKAIDRGLVLSDVRLELKSGGRSGVWERDAGSDEQS